jgi:type I restriction enzyme M protein
LTDEHIEKIATTYQNWTAEEGLSAIITNEEAARNDYNLSPSRYISQNGTEEVLLLEEAIVQLQEAEEERLNADRELEEVLKALGLGGLISGERD